MTKKAIQGRGSFFLFVLVLLGTLAVSSSVIADGGPPPGPGDYVSLWIQIDGVGNVTRNPPGTEWLGSFRYPVGTKVTLTAHPGEGYWCIGWTVETEGGQTDYPIADPGPGEPTFQIIMDADKTVTVHFKRYWTLTVNVAPVDENEVFAHGNVKVNGEMPDSYPATYQFLEGTPVDLEAVPNATWDFDHWEGDLTGTNPQGQVRMDGDKQVTAVFDYHLYELTVNKNGCGTVSVDGNEVEDYPGQFYYHYMQQAQLSASACVGWHFADWDGDLTGTDNPATITMDSDKTVVASFAQDEYTLEVNIQGQGTVTVDPDQPTYHYGDPVHLHAEAATGWYFDHWEGDASGTNPDTDITMDGHKTVTAVFLPYEYHLTINIQGQGTVHVFPDKETYHYGDVVQLTAVPDDCWEFVNWSDNVEVNDPAHPEIGTITITGDTTVTATFQKIIYTLNVSVDPEGVGIVEVSPDDLDPDTPGYQFYCGTEVTLTAQAPIGSCYYFDHWSGGVSNGDATVSFIITSDMDVTAHFEKFQYALTVVITPDGAGSVQVEYDDQMVTLDHTDTLLLPCGTEVTLTAEPAPCYGFAGWSGDVTGSDPTVNLTLLGQNSFTVTAQFEKLSYDLTVDVQGNGSVKINGDTPSSYPYTASFECGTQLELEAVPAEGWAFDHWEGDLSGSDNPITLTIDADKSVTAVFIQSCTTAVHDLPGGWNLISIPLRPGCGGCPNDCWTEGSVTMDVAGSASAQVTFGVAPDASDGPGTEDIPAPPPSPSETYTYAHFLLDGEKYRQEIKAPMSCEATKTWTLEIQDQGSATQITISWDSTAFGEATECLQSVVLTDTTSGAQVDMLRTDHYTYTKSGSSDTRTFTITVSCHCPAGAVFGDDISPLGLYRWNSCNYRYDEVEDSSVAPEKGYWLFVPGDGATVDVVGLPVTEDVSLSLGCNGWHMISVPWPFSRSDILFSDGSETKTWDEAVAARWIADVLWRYDPESERYQLTESLDPWQGYWLLTYNSGLTMILRYEYSQSGSLGPSALEVKSEAELPPPPPAAPTVDLSKLDVINEPNPVRDVHTTVFKVVGPAAAYVEAMRVRIFDASGRLVYEAEAEGSELVWHTQDLTGAYLANGVYLYRVEVKVGGEWITTEVKKLAIYR